MPPDDSPPDEPLEARAARIARELADNPRLAELVAQVLVRQQRLLSAALDAMGKHGGSVEQLSRLPSSVYPGTTIDTMSSALGTESSTPGPKFEAKHPLPVRIKALGTSTPKVAAELTKSLRRTVARTTVRSWYLPKGHDDARPIPIDAVEFFEREPWNIPRSAWKNGIKDPA